MKFGTDFNGPQRMYPTDFGGTDFLVTPPAGTNVNLSFMKRRKNEIKKTLHFHQPQLCLLLTNVANMLNSEQTLHLLSISI